MRNPSLLVADIGGTNARFALTEPGAAQPPLRYQQAVATADFASLRDAVEHYLGQLPGAEARPSRAVFAVASAVTGDAVKITNNPWAFSIRELGAQLRLDALDVINDFTAMASVLPVLHDADLQTIGNVARAPSPTAGAGERRCYAVVGPGTGLGVGGVIVERGRSVVIESEGGHVGFAPGTAYELELLRVLLPRFGRVSAERLISGTGLVNLYDAVRAVDGLPAESLTPPQISAIRKARPRARCRCLPSCSARLPATWRWPSVPGTAFCCPAVSRRSCCRGSRPAAFAAASRTRAATVRSSSAFRRK